MRKVLFILFLLFVGLEGVGQNDSTKTNSKFSLGINFSVGISHPSYIVTDKGKNNAFLVDYSLPFLDSLESSKIGYSFGISTMYQISKRIALESGVIYSNKGYKFDEIEFFDAGAYILDTGRFIYSYTYIDIPLKINFYLISKKVKLFLSAGLSANIFITSTVNGFADGENILTESTRAGVNPINISVMAGFGVDYGLSDKFNLRIQPQYQRFLISVLDESTTDGQLKRIFYSTEIVVGLNYNF